MARNSITSEQYREAYLVGLDLYDGKVGIADALRRLAPTGIARASAADLVYNVSHMLRGQRYARALSLAATRDYLEWIRSDRGEVAYESARSALSQHIEYYEGLPRGSRLPGLRAILGSSGAASPGPQAATIQFEWGNRTSRGAFDVLPVAWFAAGGFTKNRDHAVVSIKSGRTSWARCDVNVEESEATLDYTPYAPFNKANGMAIGATKLMFSDTDRTALSQILWRPRGQRNFVREDFNLRGYTCPPPPPYVPPPDKSEKTERSVRERPGQAAFRRSLKAIYSQQCCITGCSVSEALEAAHIDPYRAPESDNPRNGLLLRRDIHALFDAHIISIDPKDLTICVTSDARRDPLYAALHGEKLRLPKERTHHPDHWALNKRWNEFEKAGRK